MNGGSTPVVFSRHEYAYGAEPGNAVVVQGGSVVFHNFTDQTIVLRDFRAGWVQGGAALRDAGERLMHAVRKAYAERKTALPTDPVSLPPGGSLPVSLAGVTAGQYFYRGSVGDTGLEVQGGSSPGIILTP